MTVSHAPTQWTPAQRRRRRVKRMLKKNREIIMIALTLAMSLAFLAVGFGIALYLESQHPSWFTNGF